MLSGDPIQARADVIEGLRQLGGRFEESGDGFTIHIGDETHEAADVFEAAQIVADAIDRANEPTAVTDEITPPPTR